MKAFITLVYLSALLAVAISFSKIEEDMLKMHNNYRRKHRVGPLKLSDKLNKEAKKCASYYANMGYNDHSCPEAQKYGENLYSYYKAMDKTQTDAEAIKTALDGWYNEVSDYYDYQYPYDEQVWKTLHFTQVIWKATTELGVGIARDWNKNVYVCTLYNPQGNKQDFDSYETYKPFQVNVLPPF